MHRPTHDHHQSGMAMLLVLMSVAMAVILSLSFLNAQVTATGMAQNVARRAQGRAVAESGLAMALAYIETTSTWRTDMVHGTWVASHAYAGGSFTVIGQDGQDTDGNGTIDGDGNLADDTNDLVTLSSTGTFDGVSHTIRAVVTPMPPKKRLLLVVPDLANLDDEEKVRREQFAAWDYVVTLIGASETQAAFDSAVANADVVYVPENISWLVLNVKLRSAAIGVVCEETGLNIFFGLTTGGSPSYSGATQIDVTNNTHFITEWLTTGLNTIVASSSVELRYFSGTLASDAILLATQSSSTEPVLVAIEMGGTLVDSTPAAGRRVVLPWGGNNFNWSELTPAGLTIVRRSLQWASEPVIAGQIAHWDLDESTGTVAGDLVGGFDGTHRNGVALGNSGAMVGSAAAEFDGANDHIEVPHNNAFLLDEGTFAFWFKTSDVGSTQGLVSKDSADYDTGGQITIFIHNGDHAEVEIQDTGSTHKVKTGNIVQANTWHHLAFTFGPGGMKLYFDGVLEDTDSHTGGMGTTSGGTGNFEPMAFGVSTMVSGDLSLTGWNEPLSGGMDEVYVFNRALTQTEIQSLMTPAGGAGFSYDVRWDDQP